MEIKYLAQENEIQKIYSDLGLIVPVGDLSTTKAPAIQPLPTSSTQTTVTAQFNVMSGGDITALSYKVNDGEAVSLTPAKGVVTITLEDLEYNSGPYEIEITATNETGSTVTSSTIDLQHYTNWATADEVLDGNKFIGEDGEEHVGEIVTKTGDNVTVSGGNVTIPAGYYGEQVTKTYPVDSGTLQSTLNQNGTFYIDVNGYAMVEADVNVQPNLETASITPTTSAQTITPSTGYDGIGTANVAAVTSSIDANIQAGNIKKDVEILGVTGTYEGSGGGPSNYLELQLGDPSPWEDAWQNKYSFGGYLTLNLNDLTIPEGGTYSGNTPQAWVADMEFLQCYLDAQHNDFFTVDSYGYNGMLNDPRQLGNAFITSDGTVIIPCSAAGYEFDPDTGDPIPNYGNIPCGQTNLTGDFEVFAVTGEDPNGTGPIYEVVATGTYFIPATQAC